MAAGTRRSASLGTAFRGLCGPYNLGPGFPMSEGVIKFRCHWTREPIPLDPAASAGLLMWRSRLREQGLLGVDADGVGYGNVSVRVRPVQERRGREPGSSGPSFLITGSGTGGLAEIDDTHLSLVTDCRIEENLLFCRGLSEASSESLSHAAIYRAGAEVGAVIHAHSARLWGEHLGKLPSTPPDVGYGTPEMALSLESIVGRLSDHDELGRSQHVVVMGGHPDGLIAYGRDLDEAGEELLGLVLGQAG